DYVFSLYGYLFFFQAEDGIRDATVTGVQTCALPISVSAHSERPDVLVGRVVDVQHRLVGREGEAVRQGKVVHQQVEGPVGSEAVHTVAGLLLSGDGLGPPARRPHHAWPAGLDGVGRVGEVDGAVGLDHDVVWAVEALALKVLR